MIRYTASSSASIAGVRDSDGAVIAADASSRIVRSADLQTVLHYVMTPLGAYDAGSSYGGAVAFDFTALPAVKKNEAAFTGLEGVALEMEYAEEIFIRLRPRRSDQTASGSCQIVITDLLGIASLTFSIFPGGEWRWNPGSAVELVSTASIEFNFYAPVNLEMDFLMSGTKPPAA